MSLTAGIALISGLFGGLISGFFLLRSKQNEYVNDYYKLVIQRRVAAYELVENLIIAFKSSVIAKGDAQHPYHLAFSTSNHLTEAQVHLARAMDNGLWQSEETFGFLRDLNRILYHVPDEEVALIPFGKQKYEEIANLRERLERAVAADLLNMPDVAKFLCKKKKQISGYAPFDANSTS